MPREETLLDMLKRHEGSNKNKDGRHMVYICTSDKLTTGYGRNLTDVGISEDEAVILLVHDMEKALRSIATIFPGFYGFSPNRKKAIIDMIFNLGHSGFLTFRKMIKAIREEDWKTTAAEAKNSKWYKQVGGRGVEVVSMLLKG